jgi:DNA polymerase III delta prime subunit
VATEPQETPLAGKRPLVNSVEANNGSVLIAERVEVHGDLVMGRPKGLTPDLRNRAAAIKRVRADWIDGLLASSLKNVARIELRLETLEDAVDWGVKMLVQMPERDPEMIKGPVIGEVFERMGQALLVLGDPGTGKTTLLLELARSLLDKAEQDETQPIPVIFNLSSWAVKHYDLETWLIDEMNARSDIPKRIGSDWVKNNQIVPLLDGLDEVGVTHRSACVQAINKFRNDHGISLPIAVCSRSADYEALGEKLRLRNAIQIQALNDKEVEAALSSSPDLGMLTAAVRADPSLTEILRTPLMLWIAALAYSNVKTKIPIAADVETTKQQLFASYVEAMFRRRSGSVRYSQVATIAWLERLAKVLKKNNLTVFTLEGLDWNFWFGRGDRIYAGSACAIGMAVLFAVWVYLVPLIGYQVSWPFTLLLHHYFHPDRLELATWSEQISFAGMAALYHGLVLVPMAAIAALSSLKPVDKVRVSFEGIKSRFVSALLVGVIAAALTYLAARIADPDSTTRVIPSPFLIAPICMLMRLVLVQTPQARSVGNEGTRRSMRVALVSTVATLLIGLAVSILSGLHFWLFVATLVGGLAGGFFALRHYVFRSMLWVTRAAPLRYVDFLNYASSRILLRRVGGGYVFTHRLLLEYFAELHGE